MAWDIIDFTIFGAMLLGVGVIYTLAKRNSDNKAYRFAGGIELCRSKNTIAFFRYGHLTDNFTK